MAAAQPSSPEAVKLLGAVDRVLAASPFTDDQCEFKGTIEYDIQKAVRDENNRLKTVAGQVANAIDVKAAENAAQAKIIADLREENAAQAKIIADLRAENASSTARIIAYEKMEPLFAIMRSFKALMAAIPDPPPQ